MNKTDLAKRANRRLYEEYLLNKWISTPANQAKLVMHVCKGNPNLLFKELVSIWSFEPIVDFNAQEEIENSYTERVKNWLIKHPEERTHKDNLAVLYEKQVKDYLIRANVKTIFGVLYTVTLLCEVRSRLGSRYIDSRINDLQFLYGKTQDDTRQQQLIKDDDTSIVHSKTFMTIIISMEGSRRANLYSAHVGLFKVSHTELKTLEQKHINIFRK